MLDLFGNELLLKPAEAKPARTITPTVNPCLALYGAGPENQPCVDCVHLRYRPQRNPKARYWKCDLRKLTDGPASDHRVNWPSCGRYEARTEPYSGG